MFYAEAKSLFYKVILDAIYAILTGDFPFEMLGDISHALLACDVYARSRREISLKG